MFEDLQDLPDFLAPDAVRNATWAQLLRGRNAANRAKATATKAGNATLAAALENHAATIDEEINDRDIAFRNHGHDRDHPPAILPRRAGPASTYSDPDTGSRNLTQIADSHGRPVLHDASRATPRKGWTYESALPGNRATFFNLFGGSASDTQGFKSLLDYSRAVRDRDTARLYNVAAGASEGTGADGGFSVPSVWLAQIWDLIPSFSALYNRVRFVTATSNSLVVPVPDYSDMSTGIAGLLASFVGEGQQFTAQKLKLRSMNFRLEKMVVPCPVTYELMEDAPNFEATLTATMGQGLARRIDAALIGGSGSGQPLGVLNSPATVTITKDSGQLANTITPSNVYNMEGVLLAQCQKNAIWLAHPSTKPQLFGLVQLVKNVAGTDNVGGVPGAIFQTLPDGRFMLNGRELIFNDLCSPLSTAGDLMLLDPDKILCCARAARFDISKDFYFDTDQWYFRLIQRIDAQPILNAQVTPGKGTTKLTAYVILGAR